MYIFLDLAVESEVDPLSHKQESSYTNLVSEVGPLSHKQESPIHQFNVWLDRDLKINNNNK